MWVIGGYDVNSVKNDVWSSVDGVHWTQATAAAPFTARSSLQALVLNNQLCIVAGDDSTRTHDMWCSPDGAQWRVGAKATLQF
jgi:leucine-zipper-like transcriptional regulator 1